MSVLTREEIRQRIARGELILGARLDAAGNARAEPASYDLRAGTVIWTDRHSDGRSPRQNQENFQPDLEYGRQRYVMLMPGQMISIVTHEELNVPVDICATVFSKNRLALNGIFAFNAGHVDPGFRGPIVIRLISLRHSPYTITLGDTVFTVVFHRLATEGISELPSRGSISREQTFYSVRRFADIALSNALFDLYAGRIEQRLNEHRDALRQELRQDFTKEFVTQEALWRELVKVTWKKVLAALTVVGLLLAAMKNWFGLFGDSQ